MSAKVVVVCLAIAVAACDQPVRPSPSYSPSQLSAPAAPVITSIRAGEAVRVALGPRDFVPFDQYGDAYWQRVVHVTSSETVTVESSVVVDDNISLVGGMVFVSSKNDPGRNCTYAPRSVTCVIPANTELWIEVTIYPGPYRPGTEWVDPTFTFITRRIES